MAQKKNKKAKLKKLQRQVNRKLRNLVIPAGEDRTENIAKALAPLNLHVTLATVYLVGQNLAGKYLVGFVDRNGNSYTSTWPPWAYNLAQAALLSGKPLLLIFAPPKLGSTQLIVARLSG
ncbi:MAG: hypothetical protein WAK55_03735 [Xanthobacteraceae bacterium]|jgi:hypothetical protein